MKISSKALQIIVRCLSSASTNGWLEMGPLRYPCILGKSGLAVKKCEGDGTTPIGTWHPQHLLYRADRMVTPFSYLPTRPIRKNDGWCDAVFDRNYNRPVTHPYPASAEHLWRDDHLYDLIIVLDHNTTPRTQSRGSAIFIHAAASDSTPTQGCIALKYDHLKRLTALLHPYTRITIGH